MPLYDAYVEVDFRDQAGRVATRSYLLFQQYDTTDSTSMGLVMTNAADVVTTLNLLTWDAITGYRVRLGVELTATPNISANNQVEAFIRLIDQSGERGYAQVPAWDDATYDQNIDRLLSPAFLTAANALVSDTRNPTTGQPWDAIEYAQSRDRKSGRRMT